MMKKIALLFFVLAVCCLVFADSNKIAESVWTPVAINVDGLDSEWQGIEFYKDETSEAEYAFRNDEKNLYILFVFKSPISKSTIDGTGMKVFFSLDGKKKKDLGIHFLRKDMTAEELIKSLQKKGEILSEAQKAQIRKQPSYIVFETDYINKRKVPSPKDPSVKNERPAYRFASRQKVSYYEFRIPLSRVNQPGGIGIQPGQSFSIGFEWGGMTKEMIAAQMTRRAEMSSQAAARASSIESAISGEGDDRVDLVEGPSGSIPKSKLAKKYSFWVDVKLSAGE